MLSLVRLGVICNEITTWINLEKSRISVKHFLFMVLVSMAICKESTDISHLAMTVAKSTELQNTDLLRKFSSICLYIIRRQIKIFRRTVKSSCQASDDIWKYRDGFWIRKIMLFVSLVSIKWNQIDWKQVEIADSRNLF